MGKSAKFQFLIGTIKTKLPGLFFLFIALVSIPYRYYKNSEGYWSEKARDYSFNSL